ncbi:hypothetical protein AB1Y20_008300 [Prymnesium parvum]|uniref:Homeobox domain-containing protein n=1 Tax=Prymnesium parvum TaxID=97485 RepID=A0AB34IV30_PRYPA
MTEAPRIAKARRPRWTPSDEAKALLETIFSADSFPTFTVRNHLAEQLGIDSRQVQIWFQNRRQRERLKVHSGSVKDDDDDDDDDDDAHDDSVPLLTAGKFCRGSRRERREEERVSGVRIVEAGTGQRHPEDTAPQEGDAQPDAVQLPDDATDAAADAPAPSTAAPFSPVADIPADATCAPAAVAAAAPAHACSCGATPSSHGSTCSPAVGGAASRTQLPSCDLPSGMVPPALLTMLDTPGGPRALAVAARSLLLNNPILQHPGAPCHALLTQLASITQPQTGSSSCAGAHLSAGGGAAVERRPLRSAEAHGQQTGGLTEGNARGEEHAAPARDEGPPAPPEGQVGISRRHTPTSRPGDLPPRARPTGWPANAMEDRLSSEALEVLSSQFFSG